jgi:YVTN family beta-propeller protein
VASRAGRAFVANYDDATVSVLDAHSGALLRTVALGQRPTALSVDEAAGRVFTLNSARIDPAVPYAASASTSVSVLDARSGALLRTVVPGALPSALAVDERSGHVFVTNSGDDTVSVLDARSGVMLRRVGLDGVPQALAVDAPAQRVFVGTNGPPGRLLVLDSWTGRRLHSVVVGPSWSRAACMAVRRRSPGARRAHAAAPSSP